MKRIFSLLFVVFLCVILSLPAFAEENKKADLGFSLSGGNSARNKELGWMGEFFLAQDWRFGSKDSGRHFAFLFQSAGMAYIQDNWDNGEYGASAGLGPEWYFSDSTKAGAFVFVDALGKNRFWFVHIRPTLMFSARRLRLLGGAAFHLTKPMMVSETVSDPIYWYDERGYGYDTVYQRMIAETIDYAFVRGEFVLKPAKWFELDFAGEYNQGLDQYKDIHRLEFGGKVGLLKGIIAIGAQYYKTHAEGVWSRWFDQNGWRFVLDFNPFSKQSFGDLVQRKFVDVFWPVVVVKEQNDVVPTKISDPLKYLMRFSKRVFCVNEEVSVIGEISGTPPFDVHFEWGDGTEPLDFQTSENVFTLYHKYAKLGHYCPSSWVMDKWGHKIEQCECIDIEECNKPCPEIAVNSKAFTVSPSSAAIGQEVVINWDKANATNATWVNIYDWNWNLISTDASGTKKFTFSTIRNYKFWAKFGNDCDEETVEGSVAIGCDAVAIQNGAFTISPNNAKIGEEVTVSWNRAMVLNATWNKIFDWNGSLISIDSAGSKKYTFSAVGNYKFLAKFGNNCDEKTIDAAVAVGCNAISIQEGVLTISPTSTSIGQKVTLTWDMTKAVNATSIGIYDWNNSLISTEPTGSKEYTFSAAATYEFIAKPKNSCDEKIVKVSATITLPPCNRCDPALPSGSQTDPTTNWDMSKDFYKEETIQNKTECDFDNREARFKVEYQSSGGLVAPIARIYYLLPKMSQAVIATKWDASSKTCSIWVVRIEPLSSAPIGSTIWGTLASGTTMCVYIKFTFADECGAAF
jgi:plastocyanin